MCGRAVVLSQRVFVAFLVVIKQVAIRPDADIHHGQSREKARARGVSAHLVDLRKRAISKQNALSSGHDAAYIEHCVVVFKGDGRFRFRCWW